MSRRRTGIRYVPITISLKPAMVDEIEATLGPKQSRSQWVADAIQKKLDGRGEFDLARDGSCIQMFYAFKHKMEQNGVKIDTMFYEIIRKNILGDVTESD